jgi:hypothetical protein
MDQCSESSFEQQFTKAELKAISVHKYYLSEKAGHDVGLEFAIAHWLKYHAAAWREERLRNDLDAQRAEIQKHKWIESEKAGRDLGRHAVQDWIVRFAELWRQMHDQEEECN